MTMPQDRDALAKEAQELHEKERAESERQAAELEDRDTEVNLDPNTPGGREAAVRNGLLPAMGETASTGRVPGTNTTVNESGSYRPPGPLDFVTGADGEPKPAATHDPEMPGAVTSEGPEGIPGSGLVQDGQEQDPGSLPPRSAPKSEWVEHVAATTDMSEEEAAAKTKAELIEEVTGPGEQSESEQELRETGTPVASVVNEDNENRGSSPGVNQ